MFYLKVVGRFVYSSVKKEVRFVTPTTYSMPWEMLNDKIFGVPTDSEGDLRIELNREGTLTLSVPNGNILSWEPDVLPWETENSYW